jgi:type I restriction enzyme, S subunit
VNKTLKPGWSYKKLNELGFVGRGKSKHRPRNEQSLYGGKHPFIQTAEVTASEFYIIKYSQTYTDLGLAQSKLWNKNTLCIVNAGENTAETAILKFKACFPDSIIGFIADSEKADVRFIKYYLTTIKPQLRSITKGATQDNLSVSKLLLFDILTPPLPIQRKIAGILSAYDDLIENNTRRIEILEEMARSIYREWFVNFRFPGHEQARMVDSELGPIPEGWEVKTIGDACLVGDGAHAKIKRQASGILYLTCKNLKEGGLDLSKIDYISEEDYNKYFREDSKALTKLKAGDVIFSIIGTIGEPYLVKLKDYFGISSSVAILRRNKSVLSTNYLYYWVKSEIFQNALYGIKGGVAQGYVSLEMIKSLPLYYPKLLIQNQFDVHASSILSLIDFLTQKNDNLRQTRDLLLPRLISGEIDVENLDINTGPIAA